MKPLTKRQRERGHTAIHEAGHAVIGRVLGLCCSGVTIVANAAKGTTGHSSGGDPEQTMALWDRQESEAWRRGTPLPKARDNARAAYRASMAASMAGAEAETVLLGCCRGGDGDDRRDIELMAQNRFAGLSDDLWPRHEPRMRRQVRRLVYKHREAIRRVANALLSRRTLTGEDIDAIVNRAGAR